MIWLPLGVITGFAISYFVHQVIRDFREAVALRADDNWEDYSDGRIDEDDE